MATRAIMAALVAVILAGCSGGSDSRLNPLNWFGRSKEAKVVVAANRQDPRRLVAQVINLRVEQVPGGAIVHATGLPPRQGYYHGELIEVKNAQQSPTLNFEFRAAAPKFATGTGTQQSREVLVGKFVSTQSLEGIKTIRVSGSSNALVVRR